MKPYFAFQWHITDECDQRCKHCYIFSENNNICLKQMKYEEMETVVLSCVDLCERLERTPYFYITGGDPILHPDFWKLCALLKKNHITFGILGNPFHLTDAVCKRLYGYGCRKYQFSLDGMRETHDRFRKLGSFDITIEAIDCIKKAGMYCAVMSTVSCVNKDEFPDLIDLVVEKRLMYLHLEDIVRQVDRGRKRITYRLLNIRHFWRNAGRNINSIKTDTRHFS